MTKQVLWTVLALTVSTAAAALSVRALRAMWRRIYDEEPPVPPRWAMFGSGMLRNKIVQAVRPAP